MKHIKIYPEAGSEPRLNGRKIIYTLCEATPEDIKNTPRKIINDSNCGQQSITMINKYTNKIVAVYPSITMASKMRNIKKTAISRALKDKQYTAGGYKWKKN